MSDESNFRVISGGNAAENQENDPDVALGLVLMKGFLSLNRKQKLQVIEFLNRLASSSRATED
jgi:hypothetical protein